MLCRTGEMENVLAQLQSPFIMIDHHQNQMTSLLLLTLTPHLDLLVNAFIILLPRGKKDGIDFTIRGTVFIREYLRFWFKFPKPLNNT
jgi:hypothetical protein